MFVGVTILIDRGKIDKRRCMELMEFYVFLMVVKMEPQTLLDQVLCGETRFFFSLKCHF